MVRGVNQLAEFWSRALQNMKRIAEASANEMVDGMRGNDGQPPRQGKRPVDVRPAREGDKGGTVKAVIIGEPSGASMEAIMAVYPRHKVVVDKFTAGDQVIGIGPFADLGNMAIFRTRQAAEEFAKEDPFILEGIVKSFVIRDWNDTMLE
jgi:uncharacterized protein YciI